MLSLPATTAGSQSFVAKMARMMKEFMGMTEIELDTHAAHAAECAARH